MLGKWIETQETKRRNEWYMVCCYLIIVRKQFERTEKQAKRTVHTDTHTYTRTGEKHLIWYRGEIRMRNALKSPKISHTFEPVRDLIGRPFCYIYVSHSKCNNSDDDAVLLLLLLLCSLAPSPQNTYKNFAQNNETQKNVQMEMISTIFARIKPLRWSSTFTQRLRICKHVAKKKLIEKSNWYSFCSWLHGDHQYGTNEINKQ